MTAARSPLLPLAALAAAAVLLAVLFAVRVGGRTFERVVVTRHYADPQSHPDCYQERRSALEPSATWDWQQSRRGPCAFWRDPATGKLIVIIVALAGGVLTLITAFPPDDGRSGFLRR